MSTQRGAWITRRGQSGVEAAIDQVLDRQPQPGEQIQQMPDELIEDSPYQFIAVAGAGNGITSFAERVPQEWIQVSLQLSQGEAAIVGALISDLARGQAEYRSLD